MILYKKLLLAITLLSSYATSFAQDDTGILGGVSAEQIRTGDIGFNDIGEIIVFAINGILGVSATISMIIIIIGGFRYAQWSLTQDKTKGKDTIIFGIAGFALSASAWFIVRLIIGNI